MREAARGDRPLSGAAVILLLLAVSVVAVAGPFIAFYAAEPTSLPAGADTPWYIWRAKLVAGHGIEALRESVPPPFSAKASRIGYPVLAGFLHSLVGVAPFRLAFALPAVAGVLVGLGAGALAIHGFRQPRWAFPVYAVGAGASLNVVLTSVSHADNAIVLGLCSAAAPAALLAARGSPGAMATVVLVAAGAAVHWPFAALFAAILLGAAVLFAPESLSARRAGVPLWTTPSGRLGLLVGGTALAGSAVLTLAPESPSVPDYFDLRIGEKLQHNAPEFATMGVPAAGGVVALLLPGDPARRRGLLLALAWAASAAAAVVVLPVLTVPAHRVMLFALGIPLLATAGVVGLGRLVSRLGPRAVGRSAGVVVVLAGLTAGVGLAVRGWRPFSEARLAEITQARTAGRYLEAVGGSRPVVFVIERRRPRSPRNVIRTALPPDHILRAHPYLGDPERLLAGEPTVVPGNARFNRTSLRHFEALRDVLPRRPITIALSAFRGGGQREPEGLEVAPGVTVVRGPRPPSPIVPAPPPRPARAQELTGIVARALALFSMLGLGWAVTLLPPGWLTRLALAPALGASVLVLASVVATPLGGGGPGARPWLAALAALSGWAAPLFRRLRRRTPEPA